MSIAVSKPRRKPPQKSAGRAAAAVPEFPVARMTVPEYLALLEHGIYAGHRVEMWEGWVVDRMSHGSLPASIIMFLAEWIREHLSSGFTYRNQLPIALKDSCPEPDLAIVRGRLMDFADHHPQADDLQLLIEVSDSTLKDDREIKGRMYAGAGVKEYWIVNCEERQIEVYTDPHATAKTPHYRQLTTYLPGQSVSVRIVGKKLGDLAVKDLFPAKK